jgi:hypothetical protein
LDTEGLSNSLGEEVVVGALNAEGVERRLSNGTSDERHIVRERRKFHGQAKDRVEQNNPVVDVTQIFASLLSQVTVWREKQATQ